MTAASQAYYIITFVISLKKFEAAIIYNLTEPDNCSLDLYLLLFVVFGKDDYICLSSLFCIHLFDFNVVYNRLHKLLFI